MSFDEEWAKMLNGEIYDAGHPEFGRRLVMTRQTLWEFNNHNPSDAVGLEKAIRHIFGSCGDNIHVNQPFRCDYGCNIHVGDNFFANFNLTILDEAVVTIGDNVFIGPNVSIYTACHPVDAAQRDTWVEWAEPVTIGSSVWIGGSATILPGVTIGDGSVIGAGSVVTRDVEPYTLVAGNPARPIRRIPGHPDEAGDGPAEC